MTYHISLDWDSITYEEAKRRISKIKNNKLVKEIKFYMSATDGYHVYITLFYDIHQTMKYRIRRAWKDDGNRLILDVLFRPDKDYSDVMFVKKIKGNHTWHEYPICLYTRKNYGNTEWQIKNLQLA